MECPECGADLQIRDDDGFVYWQLEVRAHLNPNLNPRYCPTCKEWKVKQPTITQ